MPARIDYVNLAAAAATFKWPAIVVLRRRAGARSVVRSRGRREPTRSPPAPLYAPACSPVARVVDLLCRRSRTNDPRSIHRPIPPQKLPSAPEPYSQPNPKL